MKQTAAIILPALLLSACAKHQIEKPLAAGIPYRCDGSPDLRVIYQGGGDRGKATLLMDSGQVAMRAAPSMSGLRYTDAKQLDEQGYDPADETILVWWTDGIKGTLSEVPAAQAVLEEGKVLLDCVRTGWAPAAAD